MKDRILIVEDEEDINRLLAKLLQGEGYETLQAYSGTEALLLLEREKPDLILTDLMLPGISGEELLGKIREKPGCTLPVLVLTARAALKDRVTLLKAGADDYIIKPFEPEEVAARVCAALRRAGRGTLPGGEPEKICYKNIVLYPEARQLLVKGREVVLTAHEYDLLYLFLRHPEKVFSRERLYELVWKGGYYGENNTVNVHVSNLRRKIKESDPEEEYIRTVYGIGFQLR